MTYPILAASCEMLVSIVTPVQGQAALLADSFNRADDTDLNASAAGKSGTLGALDWIEVVGDGDPAISNNHLNMSD